MSAAADEIEALARGKLETLRSTPEGQRALGYACSIRDRAAAVATIPVELLALGEPLERVEYMTRDAAADLAAATVAWRGSAREAALKAVKAGIAEWLEGRGVPPSIISIFRSTS